MLSKVSIITRTKNRIVLLKRAIESVLNQEHQDWIHVIVNDGGDSAEVDDLLQKYKKQYNDRLIVVHNPKSVGMEAASNIGIKAAGHTDYLIIHDDDDSWYPSFLSKMINHLHKMQKISPSFKAIVCHSENIIEEIQGDTVIEKESHPFNDWLKTIDFGSMLTQNCFAPISFLFEASLINEIGGFNEELPVLGDWDFHLRVLKHYDIYVLPEMLARYHHRKVQTGSYSNSVVGGVDKHVLFRSILVNKWVREDISEKENGFGKSIIQQENFKNLSDTIWHNVIPVQQENFKNLSDAIWHNVVPVQQENFKNLSDTIWHNVIPQIGKNKKKLNLLTRSFALVAAVQLLILLFILLLMLLR